MLSLILGVAIVSQTKTPITIARPGGAGNWHLAADYPTLLKLRFVLDKGTLGDFSYMRETNLINIVKNDVTATILETKEDATKVHIADGREGWVDTKYVVDKDGEERKAKADAKAQKKAIMKKAIDGVASKHKADPAELLTIANNAKVYVTFDGVKYDVLGNVVK